MAVFRLGMYREAEKQFKSALKQQEMVDTFLYLAKVSKYFQLEWNVTSQNQYLHSTVGKLLPSDLTSLSSQPGEKRDDAEAGGLGRNWSPWEDVETPWQACPEYRRIRPRSSLTTLGGKPQRGLPFSNTPACTWAGCTQQGLFVCGPQFLSSE